MSRRVRQVRAAVAVILAALAEASASEREAIGVALRPITDPGRLRGTLGELVDEALADCRQP